MILREVTADYVLSNGSVLTGDATRGLFVRGPVTGTRIDITIEGLISLSRTDGEVPIGVAYSTDSPPAGGKLLIASTGAVQVNSEAARFASAVGINAIVDVTVHGLVQATASYSATAVSSTSGIKLENTGTIRATGATYATALHLSNGGELHNSGLIEATSLTPRDSSGVLYGTSAVYYSGSARFDFLNTGTIRALTPSEPAATAVIVFAGGSSGLVRNDGLLQGDVALRMGVPVGARQEQVVTNTGTLDGKVILLGGAFRLENSGRITGAVEFGLGDDTYSGLTGSLNGALNGGEGSDSIGGSGNGESLSGGGGDDTIDGAGGDDVIDGGPGNNVLAGGAGIDTLRLVASANVDLIAGTARYTGTQDAISGFEIVLGSHGDDTLAGIVGGKSFGGGGHDLIRGTSGANYLRGDEGNDSVQGGVDFDDINGNMGDDTASGGLGDDWVVGGKDNDRLSGDVGSDIVYGNLGNDVCEGGDGDDIVRGGQQDDSINGGAGDDYVSGDKGDDTVTGGAGADLFHTFGDAGIDRVTDFDRAEGDRVQLDPGTQYTVAQVGADTVISMTGGGQMILVGVQMSSLTEGWIFGA